MNSIEFEAAVKEFESRNEAFIKAEKELLSVIEELFPVLEKRQIEARELTTLSDSLRKIANEQKTPIAAKFHALIVIGTKGEVLKAWMDRYEDRKHGEYDLSYNQLISPRPEPREKPGKLYSSTGQEISTIKRKVLIPGSNMGDEMRELSKRAKR